MSGILKKILTRHWLLTLGLMGLFGLLFGIVSLNIIALLHANFSLVVTHGAMALMDGALRQLLELVAYGYLSVIFWLLFKACESVLVGKMVQ
jgi:predicted TIM-barrel enzyme